MSHELLADKRVLVCLGSGGVGKTTTSAVIALHAALLGRKVLVLTVDPAKRLANSLGVEELGDREREIEVGQFTTGEHGAEGGQLFAMMLDMKHAFDRLVDRHAPDEETRARIHGNRFYSYFSSSLAGTQEYSAMERLYELYEETDYDLIVLDTPPTAHALDFLDAPSRMFAAIDSKAFQWVVRSSKRNRFGLGFVKMGANYMMKAISRFTGNNFLDELSEFVASFGDMWEGFKERAARTREILGGDDVAFLIVSAPESVSLGEADYLYSRLRTEAIGVAGFVVNRVHQPFVPQPVLQADASELAKRLPDVSEKTAVDLDGLAERMQATAREFHVLADRDQAQLAGVRRRLGDRVPVYEIPFFSTDIYSFEGLDRIRRELFGLSRKLKPSERTPGRL